MHSIPAIYSAIFQTAKKMNKTGKDQKYTRSARTMMLFVGSYLLQNTPYIIYTVWLPDGDAPLALMISAVCFTNIGGLCNLIVYFTIRRERAV